MILEYYEKLKQNDKARETLSKLRSLIKEEEARQKLAALAGDGSVILDFLKHEDAKTRKNAALLIGDLKLEQAKEALLHAYEAEQTRFVKSAYLNALSKLNPVEYLDFFKAQREVLLKSEPIEEEKKHAAEELGELFAIITGIEGRKEHSFIGFKTPQEILLTTNREQREATLSEVAELSAAVQRSASLHPLGVLVYTKEVKAFTRLRSYRELLFPLAKEALLSHQPKEAAEQLFNSGLLSLLKECHEGDAPFFFRVEVKAEKPQAEYAKKLAMALEQISRFELVNAPKDYEAELRLVASKEGGYAAFLKLRTIPMKRFAYRKNAVAMSIHPAAAAMLMRLAKPYLKENAQILDPCCGVGTMLIERNVLVPARELYGIDIFGDAIIGGRENAARAGVKINFVHRDFFDFKHTYLFDEIITNLPLRGKRTKEETDAFYAAFFQKAETLLAAGGKIILYTNESGFVKKQLRLQKQFRLVKEFQIRKKEGFYLYIITI